jgi:hypothetical protein
MGMTTSGQTISRTMPGLAPHALNVDASLGSRAVAALAALRCKLQGHAPALCVDDRRMYLACPDCHAESPGWELDIKAPRPRFTGAPDRFARYSWIMGRGQA